MTYSTEWANVQGVEQMELATVVDHRPRPIRAKDLGITYEAFCASSGRQLAKLLH